MTTHDRSQPVSAWAVQQNTERVEKRKVSSRLFHTAPHIVHGYHQSFDCARARLRNSSDNDVLPIPGSLIMNTTRPFREPDVEILRFANSASRPTKAKAEESTVADRKPLKDRARHQLDWFVSHANRERLLWQTNSDGRDPL